LLSTGTREQIDATRRALSEITSRPISVISAEIAATENWRNRRALSDELKESRKAQSYRDDLIRLQGVATNAETTTGIDIVTGRIASVTGSSEASITLIIGLILSMLLELFGVLLWLEVILHSDKVKTAKQYDPIKALWADLKAGKLNPTVKAIRIRLGCSQVRAMAVRKEYLSAKEPIDYGKTPTPAQTEAGNYKKRNRQSKSTSGSLGPNEPVPGQPSHYLKGPPNENIT
jgi:hypothetical protein